MQLKKPNMLSPTGKMEMEEKGKMPKSKMSESITPEMIVGKLFSYHNIAHFFHLQTTTIGHHLLLDELYKGLVESKDEISEYLLGIQAPKRLGAISLDPVPPYSDEAMVAMIDDGFQFSVKVCEYADNLNLEELCNLASDLQGKFAKAKLFTTYK